MKKVKWLKEAQAMFLLASVLTVGLKGISVKAASGNIDSYGTEEYSYHTEGKLYDESYSLNPYVVRFQNQENIMPSLDSPLSKPTNGKYLFCLSYLFSSHVTDVYENGYSKPKLFVQYISAAWAKRSQYTETATYTASWSRSSNISLDIADAVKAQYGRSTSASAGIGIGSVIPADATRYSKLAMYADFYDYYLKCIERDEDHTTIYNTYYGDVYFPTGDIYFDVVYQ